MERLAGLKHLNCKIGFYKGSLKRQKMRKIIKVSIILVILATLILGARFIFFNTKESSVGVFVSAAVEQDTLLTSISATGSLEPVDRVEIGTQVSGDLSRIYVDFNSKVKKGQVLAELDKSKWITNLRQSELAYKAAENDFQYKKIIFERTQKLAESKSVSTVELETAEYNMNAARFSMERSKSDVEQAKLNLSYCVIKSPIDGVVLERSVDVGQTVAASMSAPVLFILARDLSQMRVMASVDEADIGSILQGQRVEFTVDAFPKDRFFGKVEELRLNPTVTSNVVTYTVVISAENPEFKLLPGMTATCTIVTKEEPNAVVIPMQALHFKPAEGSYKRMPRGQGEKSVSGKGKKSLDRSHDAARVWVSVNGQPEPRRIKTGINDGVRIQVLEGLSVGDSVIVNQQMQTVKEEVKKEGDTATSPFMPKRPGRRR
jgi:HlyD family secretion protein